VDAGDAGGILLSLVIGVIGSVAGFVTDDQGALKDALNVVVADEQVLDSPEGVPMR
jgi:hypothetical protein